MNNLELLRKVGIADEDIVIKVDQEVIDTVSMRPCRKVDREGKAPIYISTLRWTDPEQGPKKMTIFGDAEGQVISLGDSIECSKGAKGSAYADVYGGRIVKALK